VTIAGRGRREIRLMVGSLVYVALVWSWAELIDLSPAMTWP
jgi:hypothetical protein